MDRSPYALGFSTLDREASLDDLPVRGAIPSWLTGTLVRTGPAKFEAGEQSYRHWFDGLAMLHKFGFAEGRVTYANRFLRSRAYTEATTKRKIVKGEFATDPCRTIFQRVVSWFWPDLTDNANVSVNKLAGDILAFTETPQPIRFDPETLRTLGPYEYDQAVRGMLTIAHPHLDHARARHYSYQVEFGRRSTYRVFSIEQRTGRQALLASIPVERPAYMHSFGMTERFLVLTEFPLVVNPLRLRFSGQPFIRNYRWEPDRGVCFHVIEKATGRVVRKARSRPVFAFHHVNAFEEDADVIVDVVTYPDPGIIDQLYLDRLRSGDSVTGTGTLTRFRVGTGAEVRDETLAAEGCELPRIDYRRRAGKPYRYVYGTGNQVAHNFIDKLVKWDLARGEGASWFEEGMYPGEPVFVAAPGASGEDEGVILSVVLDARSAASFLLVLDAAMFRELARAQVPHHIPFALHGNYFPDTSGPLSFRDLHR